MFLRTLVLYGALAAACAGQVSDRARKLHQDAFVFDAHVHVINRQLYLGGDIGERASNGQVDLPRMREGGIDALAFTVYVSEEYYPPRLETKQALRLIDLAHQQIEKNRDRIELALSAREIDRIHRAGKIAAVLDLEGGFDLEGDLGVLRNFYRLGLRMAQLPAHNWTNEFADSCCAKPKWNGLNDRGREVIREMNRLGILINVSHASDAAIEQTVEVSAHPVLATHHGLRSFNDIPRTLPDHLVKAIAAKGGVVGFHIGNEFHNRKMFEWRTKNAGKPFWDTTDVARRGALTIEAIDQRAARSYPMVGVNAPEELLFSPEDWLKVVERTIELAGEDHVGLGSDFDGGPTPPRGMKDIADLPRLTEAMLRRGWPEQRIRKFLGENWMRVVRQVLK
jgi:membrane dipeptidase